MKTQSAAWYIRQTKAARAREVENALEAIVRQFEALRDIGEAGSDVVPLLGFPRRAKRLKARAARLRGAVLRAFTVLAEAQAQIGRLEQVAEALDE